MTHRLTGYDRVTEFLALAHPVPTSALPTARIVAQVLPADEGAAGVYVLQDQQARHLGHLLGLDIDTDHYEWCLEPLPQPLEAVTP